jgi:hypothetical protein
VIAGTAQPASVTGGGVPDRIVMRPDYVQVVHMAHEGFVARATGVSKFGARAPGKRYKLLRNRLAGIGEGLSGGREISICRA